MMHMCLPNPMLYSGTSFPGPAKPSSGGGSAPVVTMDDMIEEFLQKYHTGKFYIQPPVGAHLRDFWLDRARSRESASRTWSAYLQLRFWGLLRQLPG